MVEGGGWKEEGGRRRVEGVGRGGEERGSERGERGEKERWEEGKKGGRKRGRGREGMEAEKKDEPKKNKEM